MKQFLSTCIHGNWHIGWESFERPKFGAYANYAAGWHYVIHIGKFYVGVSDWG